PTRELAEQVYQVLLKLGEARGVKVALIVGGEPLGPQVKELQAGAQVVVGTPGRVLDLMNQRFLQFPWTEFAVLDEADKMLEIGFIDDIKKILDACNEYRQTLLFSATFPPQLLELARGYTGEDPAEIANASGVATVDTINQYVLRCSTDETSRNLAYLIEDSAPDDVFLVFCERRTDVDQLMRKLERRRFSVKALHGGYDQAARFRVMTAFRTGDVKCLVATDVASRGLDVAHVTHVVNLGLPREFSDYTHRIGRTGRAGRHGVAVTFISGRNERDFQALLKHTGFDIDEIDRPRDLYALERRKAAKRSHEGDADEEEVDSERPRREKRVRRPRRDRSERPRRADSESPRSESATEPSSEREERPRRTRRPRRDDEEGAPLRAERAERPARRPRRERIVDRDEELEERGAEEAPRRRRRSRRDEEGKAEREPRRRSRAERAEPGSEERDERPRRSRRRSSESRSKAHSESSTEAPEDAFPQRASRRDDEGRPRRRSRSRADEADDAVEAAEAIRAPRRRRPRRDRTDHASGDASRDDSSDDSPKRSEERPRRPRRRAQEDSSEEAPRRERRPRRSESTSKSSGKEESKRPKRGRRGQTSSPSKEAAPERPVRKGGFGSGI
ncbi:MAG: DEAD/DEAH box helicase, partial [Planctomycetota bacterium]